MGVGGRRSSGSRLWRYSRNKKARPAAPVSPINRTTEAGRLEHRIQGPEPSRNALIFSSRSRGSVVPPPS
jgi:hypothetical protein